MAGIPLPDVRTAAPRYRSRHLRVLAALRRAHPAFLGAEPAALARLAAVTTIGVVPRDGTVFLEGEPAGQLFVVAAGTVRLYTLLADGRRQVFGFPGPGDVFGLETDAGGGYPCHAQAVTPVVLGRVRRRPFEAAAAEWPGLARAALAVEERELLAARGHAVLLGRRTAPERIAAFLLGLVRRAAARGRPAAEVRLAMTRGDIADHLGLSVETVSRTFGQLARAGIVALPEPHRVVILDRAALERLVEGAPPGHRRAE